MSEARRAIEARPRALPRPVWDSWHTFLGSPTLQQQPDGTWRLLDDLSPEPSNWIYIFDIDEHPAADGGPAPIRTWRVIGTDAATLTRAALEIAPAKAIERGEAGDSLLATVATRMRKYLPDVTV